MAGWFPNWLRATTFAGWCRSAAKFSRAGRRIEDLGAIAYTEGPGLAGALLAGAAFARGMAQQLGVPAIGIHHLEGHLLSPLLSARAPAFPFVALLVSGGHTQLMRVHEVGRYELLGETQDDAAGEAFDKTAKLLGLGYPGGPALSKLAETGQPGRYKLPRPMIGSGDLEFSFPASRRRCYLLQKKRNLPPDLARCRRVSTCSREVRARDGRSRLTHWWSPAAWANQQLRGAGRSRAPGSTSSPEPELCTDNGAMIASRAWPAGGQAAHGSGFGVRPR
jgi:N6-L-threonylcarbamoyladenine synthase